MGALVQADPQPEIGRVGAEFPFDLDDVRCHQQQAPRPGRIAAERVELAENLAGQEPEDEADLRTGDAAGPGARRPAAGGGELRGQRCRQQFHALGGGLDPTGPVDHVGVIDRQPVAEPGGVPDGEFRAGGECPQVGDHRGRLGGRDGGPGRRELLPGPHRCRPVDRGRAHVCTHQNHGRATRPDRRSSQVRRSRTREGRRPGRRARAGWCPGRRRWRRTRRPGSGRRHPARTRPGRR